MPENLWLFAVLALLSEIIGTVSGFGSSILFVPIASYFYDFKSVLGITAVFHVFSNLSKIYLFRQGIDKKIALKLGIPAVIAVTGGALLTGYLPAKEMQVGMNVMLVALSVYLIIDFNKKLKQTNSTLYIGGTVSGFLAGLFGTGGAIRGITLAAFQLPMASFIATSALIDLGVDGGRAIVYISQGYFKRDYILLIPLLIAISIVGSYTGKKILRYTSEKVFRYLVLTVIITTCLIEVFKYFKN
jgi:uncharacterized membrane protein YfcA